MKEIKIALRNLQRNRKRSYLTVSVMLIGITFTVFGLSYFDGVIEQMFSGNFKFTGHVLISHPEYKLKEKMLDITKNISVEEAEEICRIHKSEITGSTARVRFGALVFHNDLEKQAAGAGISQDDYQFTGFSEYIYEGQFLDFSRPDSIIVGKKLKEQLNLSLGEEITLLSQTQSGSVTALNYRVTGFYDMENGRFNRGFYITLTAAQDLLDMHGRATEYLVFVKKIWEAEKTAAEISRQSDNRFLVQSWTESSINRQMIAALPVIKFITVGIFCLLSATAVINTMMMTVFERRREIGIFKALGMTDWQIIRVLCLEGTALGATGALLGVLIGGSLSLYFSHYGINLGSAVESVPLEIYIKNTIYFKFGPVVLFVGFSAGTLTSFLATLFPVIPGVKNAPAVLMRD